MAHEALLYLLDHPKGNARIREAFNDALYTGKAPPDMLQGLTVLLPKTMAPKAWGDTRPITLSSSLLKWLAQLLLHRGRKYIGAANPEPVGQARGASRRTDPGRAQATPSSKGLGGIPLCIVKLDVAKAFDSISQLYIGKLIADKVENQGGMPWEALLWMQLIRADTITLATWWGDPPSPTARSSSVRQ